MSWEQCKFAEVAADWEGQFEGKMLGIWDVGFETGIEDLSLFSRKGRRHGRYQRRAEAVKDWRSGYL
ncbi:MAG: hypothetical protein KAY96_01165, partial [Bacteroidia bacterium]|nr:hypothetical protein [Bacteroidia bacterium]